MTSPIDLRSDTVTRPSPAMRRAMADAEVGDDVYGEDPTVAELQRDVAALLGKEAALYFPSGTMANQVALRVHTEPGDEVILEAHGHSYAYETGALAALSGVQARPLPGDHGLLAPHDVARAMLPAGPGTVDTFCVLGGLRKVAFDLGPAIRQVHLPVARVGRVTGNALNRPPERRRHRPHLRRWGGKIPDP